MGERFLFMQIFVVAVLCILNMWDDYVGHPTHDIRICFILEVQIKDNKQILYISIILVRNQ